MGERAMRLSPHWWRSAANSHRHQSGPPATNKPNSTRRSAACATVDSSSPWSANSRAASRSCSMRCWAKSNTSNAWASRASSACWPRTSIHRRPRLPSFRTAAGKSPRPFTPTAVKNASRWAGSRALRPSAKTRSCTTRRATSAERRRWCASRSTRPFSPTASSLPIRLDSRRSIRPTGARRCRICRAPTPCCILSIRSSPLAMGTHRS